MDTHDIPALTSSSLPPLALLILMFLGLHPIASKALVTCIDCSGPGCNRPGLCETDGKCFLRRDVNGLLYRGCADNRRWRGLNLSYNGCRWQNYLGWANARVLWCLCFEPNCNSVTVGVFMMRNYSSVVESYEPIRGPPDISQPRNPDQVFGEVGPGDENGGFSYPSEGRGDSDIGGFDYENIGLSDDGPLESPTNPFQNQRNNTQRGDMDPRGDSLSLGVNEGNGPFSNSQSFPQGGSIGFPRPGGATLQTQPGGSTGGSQKTNSDSVDSAAAIRDGNPDEYVGENSENVNNRDVGGYNSRQNQRESESQTDSDQNQKPSDVDYPADVSLEAQDKRKVNDSVGSDKNPPSLSKLTSTDEIPSNLTSKTSNTSDDNVQNPGAGEALGGLNRRNPKLSEKTERLSDPDKDGGENIGNSPYPTTGGATTPSGTDILNQRLPEEALRHETPNLLQPNEKITVEGEEGEKEGDPEQNLGNLDYRWLVGKEGRLPEEPLGAPFNTDSADPSERGEQLPSAAPYEPLGNEDLPGNDAGNDAIGPRDRPGPAPLEADGSTPAPLSTRIICPANFKPVPHLRSCYHIDREPQTWWDAEKHCNDLHPRSHLVSLDKPGEYEYVILKIAMEPVLMNHWQGWWTSGKYDARIREFTWSSSGHVISRLDPKWRPVLVLSPYVRTCVWLVPLAGFRLGNYGCLQPAGAICEVEV